MQLYGTADATWMMAIVGFDVKRGFHFPVMENQNNTTSMTGSLLTRNQIPRAVHSESQSILSVGHKKADT